MLYQGKPQRNSYKADLSVLSLIFSCIYISLGEDILKAFFPHTLCSYSFAHFIHKYLRLGGNLQASKLIPP